MADSIEKNKSHEIPVIMNFLMGIYKTLKKYSLNPAGMNMNLVRKHTL